MSEMEDSTGFLDLPDDVICELLRYLDATSLYLLGKTCSRLDELIRGHFTLWRRIDARRAPNDQEKISYCLERCYNDGNTWTDTFLIRADNKLETLIPINFFSKISSFSKLSVLAFENQTINGSKYNIMVFPTQLTELSLKKTVVTDTLEFFRGSGNHFSKLRVLILDFCEWLKSSAFMPISKYKDLEILSVYKCKSLENSIAYLSLSSQGFKALKIFDARLSPLGNTLITAMYRLPSLLAIYLQNEDISYKLDYFKRKLEVLKGEKSRDFYIKDEEFNIDDPLTYEENGFNYEDMGTVDDNGLLDYVSVQSEPKVKEMPESCLYVDPYNSCGCSFENNQLENGLNPDEDDDTFKNLTNRITRLTQVIKSKSSRGLLNNNHPRSAPLDNQNVFHVNLVEEPNNGNVEGPPTKRRRVDEAGPSADNDSESDEEIPDVVINNPSFRVFIGGPLVRVENIEDAHKDVTVPLRRLSLRGYKKITNAALHYIKDLDLDILDLTYTNVSFSKIEEYLRSHPFCRVVHERFCTCPTNLHF